MKSTSTSNKKNLFSNSVLYDFPTNANSMAYAVNDIDHIDYIETRESSKPEYGFPELPLLISTKNEFKALESDRLNFDGFSNYPNTSKSKFGLIYTVF